MTAARAPELVRRLRGARGQASVELVGLLPLVAAIAAAGWSVVSAQVAGEQAAAAAEAGAAALVQSGRADARVAARAVLPDDAHARIVLTGRRVHVHVERRLPIPGVGTLLAADAEADAGPEPTAGSIPTSSPQLTADAPSTRGPKPTADAPSTRGPKPTAGWPSTPARAGSTVGREVAA